MTPHLQVTNLRMRFYTGFEAGPLNLDLRPGIHHLEGANGTGKTTLLRCLCGHFKPTAGTVRVCGQDPAEDPKARRHISLMPAESELPDFLTVDEAWQQIATLRGEPDFEGQSLRQAFDIPGGLLLAHASAGQRKIAEFLCAVAGNPSVMLFDEVFANLDPGRAERITTLLESWRSERVIVVTSHLPLPMAADSRCALNESLNVP